MWTRACEQHRPKRAKKYTVPATRRTFCSTNTWEYTSSFLGFWSETVKMPQMTVIHLHCTMYTSWWEDRVNSTGSVHHYMLCDQLHEANNKDEKDILRRIGLIPELAEWLNSQVAEQFFSKMKKYLVKDVFFNAHVFEEKCSSLQWKKREKQLRMCACVCGQTCTIVFDDLCSCNFVYVGPQTTRATDILWTVPVLGTSRCAYLCGSLVKKLTENVMPSCI